jgi:DNA primase catalytic subunit
MANWYDAMSQWMNEIRASNQELNRKFDSIKSELQQQRRAATEEADEMNRKIEQQSKSIENLTAMMENELEWNALVRLTQLVDYYFLQHLKLETSAFIFGQEISLGKLIMQASRDSAVRQDLERYLVSKGSVLNFADMEKIHQVIRNVRNNFIHGRQLPELARIQTAKKYLSDGEATDLIDKIVGVLFPN